MRVSGIVRGGQRYVSSWFKQDRLHSQLLGIDLHAGSINLFVEAPAGSLLAAPAGCPPSVPAHPLFRSPGQDEDMNPKMVRHWGVLRFRRCVLNDRHEAFIMRTECPAREYEGPGQLVRIWDGYTMFEIVGPFVPELTGYTGEMTMTFDESLPFEVMASR